MGIAQWHFPFWIRHKFAWYLSICPFYRLKGRRLSRWQFVLVGLRSFPLQSPNASATDLSSDPSAVAVKQIYWVVRHHWGLIRVQLCRIGWGIMFCKSIIKSNHKILWISGEVGRVQTAAVRVDVQSLFDSFTKTNTTFWFLADWRLCSPRHHLPGSFVLAGMVLQRLLPLFGRCHCHQQWHGLTGWGMRDRPMSRQCIPCRICCVLVLLLLLLLVAV